jgi:hypothetical protein
MSTVAGLEATLLAAIAVLHVAWGLGAVWPRHDEADLVALVVGTSRDRMPTPSQCFVAAGAIMASAVVIGCLAGVVRLPLVPWATLLLGVGVSAVFAGRGVAGYLPVWRTLFPRQPFATLDRWIYSPLCLVIALTCAELLCTRSYTDQIGY